MARLHQSDREMFGLKDKYFLSEVLIVILRNDQICKITFWGEQFTQALYNTFGVRISGLDLNELWEYHGYSDNFLATSNPGSSIEILAFFIFGTGISLPNYIHGDIIYEPQPYIYFHFWAREVALMSQLLHIFFYTRTQFYEEATFLGFRRVFHLPHVKNVTRSYLTTPLAPP